ncbi:MAG TPA: hypothetical protein VHE13_00205 [Opitutus sp.]|nr:hypothetical protein [Opitutus sp.]
MAKARIKFIWGANGQLPGEWRLGLWGTYERDPGSRIKGRAISVRGLLAWLGGGALAAYLAAATALFVWFERQPFNLISYADTLLLPFRWQQVRELRGRMMIEEGLAALRARRWSEAMMQLRVGLARAPDDLRARMALAQFYLLANQWPLGLAVLNDQLKQGYPGRSYLQSLFTLAGRGDDQAAILAACDRFLPTEPEDRDWLLLQKAQALNAAGRPAEALQLAEAEGARASAALREARVIALLDLGRPDDAVAFLADWRRERPGDAAQVQRLEVRALRDAKRFAEMDAAWAAFREIAPANPRTYIYAVVQNALAERTAETNAALDEFFLRFAGSPASMALMAMALTDAGRPALVQRCADVAAQHGFPPVRFDLPLLEAQLNAGDWAGARTTLARLQRLKELGPPDRFRLAGMERLLALATGTADASPAALLEQLQQRPLPLRVFEENAQVLLLAHRLAAARSVLDLAARSYPTSPKLAKLGERVAAAAAALPAAPVATVRAAAGTPIEREFFAQLEEAAAAKRWADAARLIRETRTAKPAWLARREADVLVWQMRVAMKTADALELTAAAKLYLDGTNERATRVVELARELAGDGDHTNAEFLLGEVLRKLPEFPPAQRLKLEWHPPPKAEEKAPDNAGKTPTGKG